MTIKKITGTDQHQAPMNRDLGSMAYQPVENYINTLPRYINEIDGTSGSFNGGRHPLYQRAFCVNKANTGTSYNYNMITVDCTNQAFIEGYVTVRWATRMQGVSDATSNFSQRVYGINKFNGGSLGVFNTWNAVDGNTDTHADIVVTTSGQLYQVQLQWSSSVSASSWVWGVVELFILEDPIVNWYI